MRAIVVDTLRVSVGLDYSMRMSISSTGITPVTVRVYGPLPQRLLDWPPQGEPAT
jgi:hypothetical protein